MSKPSQAVLERQKKKITPCIRRRTTALRRFPLPQPSLVVPKPPKQVTPLSYAPTEISAYGSRIILHEPLVCRVRVMDKGKYFSIRHARLRIIAGGETWQEACQDFNEWFVHDYRAHSAWDEAHLGTYRNAFRLMKSLIKEVINREEVDGLQ